MSSGPGKTNLADAMRGAGLDPAASAALVAQHKPTYTGLLGFFPPRVEARMTFGMVVLAGGIGRRIGRPFPKQFLLLGGKPLIVWQIERLGVPSLSPDGAQAVATLEQMLLHVDMTAGKACPAPCPPA